MNKALEEQIKDVLENYCDAPECECSGKLGKIMKLITARNKRLVEKLERKSVEELENVIPKAFNDLASKVAFKDGYNQKVKEAIQLIREGEE